MSLKDSLIYNRGGGFLEPFLSPHSPHHLFVKDGVQKLDFSLQFSLLNPVMVDHFLDIAHSLLKFVLVLVFYVEKL